MLLSRRFSSSADRDRKSTRLNSSHLVISYAVFCLKKTLPRRHDPLGVAQAGHGYDLASANDQAPGFSFRSRDLGVDVQILHLLPAAGEPVAGPSASYLKSWELGFDAPLAPANAAVEGDWRLLEPDAVVLTHGGELLAEVDALLFFLNCAHPLELRRSLLTQPPPV